MDQALKMALQEKDGIIPEPRKESLDIRTYPDNTDVHIITLVGTDYRQKGYISSYKWKKSQNELEVFIDTHKKCWTWAALVQETAGEPKYQVNSWGMGDYQSKEDAAYWLGQFLSSIGWKPPRSKK